MPIWIQEILSPSRFIPHGHCYLWQPQLVWLNVLSDVLIGLAYFSIPIMLVYFVQKRDNVPFRSIFLLFSLFIVTCGTTHFLAVWTIWHPAYWLLGMVKAFTAITSVFTTLTLLPTLPVALALPEPKVLQAINQQLETEIEERKQAEASLQYQLEFDRVVSEISARFVGLNLDELDDEITRSLKSIGQFMQVDTSYIFQLDPNNATANMRYEWVSDPNKAQLHHAQDIPKAAFPWAIETLSKGEVLQVTDVQVLPAVAALEKENWQAFKIQSLISVPFIAQNHLLGWVGFASFTQASTWSESSIQLLKLLAEILTRALQHNQSERALRQSESRLKMALEAGKTICWEYDLATKQVQGFGEMAAGIWHPSRWERRGEDCQPDVYPADRENVRRAVKSAVRNIGEFSIEHRVSRKGHFWPSAQPSRASNGHDNTPQDSLEDEYWVLTKGKVLPNDDGVAARISALTIDISAQKQTEADLRTSEERWQLALKGTNDGIWDVDWTTQHVFVSPRLKEMLGYQEHEWGNKVEEWTTKIHPDDVQQVMAALSAHRNNETPFYTAEYRILCQDGRYKWVLDRGKALRNPKGIAVRLTGSLSDITDRKQAEAALRQLNQKLEARVEERTAAVVKSEQRFRSLFESAPDLIYVLDPQGLIQQINSAVINCSHYLESELVGHPLNAFLHEQHALDKQSMAELLDTGHHRQEMAFICKDGSILMVDCSCTVVNAHTDDAYILVLQRDITERHAIDRMKSEFISVVSHELRTPITSIHGALDLLDSGLVDPRSARGQHVFGIAVENADRLVKLVNDILELERLDSGKIRLNYTSISTKELLTRCYELMELMAERAGITLEIAQADLLLWADGDRLMQVLTNLVGNAIKFSEAPATVWVNVEAVSLETKTETAAPSSPASRQENRQENRLKFTVKDEGKGIPASKLEGIFKRFHQVDASDSRRKGGTGLGLAICRSIVKQHGGQIWVESSLGKGSVFSFTIPVKYIQK